VKGLAALWYPAAGESSRAARCALALLQPLACLYGAGVRARRLAYERGWLKAHAAGRPVIVVGNLTVGGTGKTPLILWLAERLQARGLTVGIVSRGYGRQTGGARRAQAASRWEEIGDEPLLVHRRTGCAVAVAEDRIIAARRLAAEGVDVILSDDGLQHLRLARDCAIVVIDGARGFGNGRLLPAGPLREPASRALGADGIVVNADGIVVDDADGAGASRAADSGRAIAVLKDFAGPLATMHLLLGEAHRLDGGGSPQPLTRFQGRPVHAVAGIGHPERFFRALAARGLELIEHAFPDHHPFARGDLDYPDDLPILMTEKDAVRCASLATPRMWHVPVETRLDEAGGAALLALVARRIDASRVPRR